MNRDASRKRYTGRLLALLSLLLLVFYAACRTGESGNVSVYAASSLTDAFRTIGAEFENTHPGQRVEFHFAGSQLLRTQIEQGAPADVFASADEDQMEALRRKSLVREPAAFARNLLVAIACSRCEGLGRLEDLARPGVKVVVAAETVPAGRYAKAFMKKLSGDAGFGADYPARVAANVMSRETSVRAVLARVVLGEADAGFVYATDAAAAGDKIRLLASPAGMEVTATYSIAALAGAQARGRATSFVRFVLGERGRGILREHGFIE